MSVEKIDRLERLADLLLLLLNAREPLTLREISGTVPGYPGGEAALKQAFERDKRTLRAEGIPVSTERIGGEEQVGYRIKQDEYFLADLGLSDDEQIAVNLALSGVQFLGHSSLDTMGKLGLVMRPVSSPLAYHRTSPALGDILEAVRRRASVSFSYDGTMRRVTPIGALLRWGRWYVLAWDSRREAMRTFRVDRIEGPVEIGADDSGQVPEGRIPEGNEMLSTLPEGPWEIGGDEPVEATVLLDGIEAPRAVMDVGESAVVERREGGSVVVRLGVTNQAAFRFWVLGMLGHAEVLAPQGLRRDMASWLVSAKAAWDRNQRSQPKTRGRVEASSAAAERMEHGPVGVTARKGDLERRAGATSPARLSAGERLQRLLALLAWTARAGMVRIQEVAERFQMTEDEVVRELELAACCGLPPYTPDQLIELVVLEDSVMATMGAQFRSSIERPRRLTPSEALAVITAARIMLQVPGVDPGGFLASASAKLERALGYHRRVAVSLNVPASLDVVKRAVKERRSLDVRYHAASSDEVTERLIDPMAVFTDGDHWYLDAFCHRAGELRRFRVDRLLSARPAGAGLRSEDASRSAGVAGAHRSDRGMAYVPTGPYGVLGEMPGDATPAGGSMFVPSPETVVATISIPIEESWIADVYPTFASRKVGEGRMEVDIPVGGEAWLARLLLRLGAEAQLVAPAELVGTGSRFAARILARYEEGCPPRVEVKDGGGAAHHRKQE